MVPKVMVGRENHLSQFQNELQMTPGHSATVVDKSVTFMFT